MKKLIIAALLTLSFTAHAEAWRMGNNSGGYIVVTSKDCRNYPNKGLRQGFAYSSTGQTLRFCWVIENNLIRAIYDDGTEYNYNPSNFVRIEGSK